MRLGSPEYFWFLLALPLLVGFFIYAWQSRQQALRRFAAAALIGRLTPGAELSRQVIRWSLVLAALLFLVLALARPRFGVKSEMIERKGVDIIVALDVSRSMLAEDVAPSRLDRAKHELGKLIDLLRGDRIGLIVFAGESYVQCPLTLDYGAARLFLDAVNCDWIEQQGTALAQAIGQAAQSFRSPGHKHKVLVIISDGEDHEGKAVDAAVAAAGEGCRIYTIGVGSEGGAPIPMSRTGGNVVYKKDRDGNLVMTRLNPAILDQIAARGNGRYFHAGTSLDLAAIYTEIARMEKRDFGMNKMTVYEEKYQLFVAVALLLLMAELLVPERVRRRDEWKGRFA